MEIFTEYELIRSKRKTISVEVTKDLCVIVRSPLFEPQKQIDRFLAQHREWIEKAIIKQKKRREEALPEPTEAQMAELKTSAWQYLPKRTAYFADIMGVEPSSVKITSAKKRLGSCSGKNGICYSCLLMRYDEEIIDYVIIHELSHIKEHNHSKRFYDLVERYCPNYREIQKKIKG
ncbi:MAG: M48 family metallopeptidase [Ruminococcaceae bacterium]|nr:M48 family metallopeptidase [Oscillospiraceae bacterium]